MEEIKNGLYRVTLDEVKARGRMTEHDTFRFRCLVCGDEDKHHRRFDGSFNQREGVGQCFCCGSRFVLVREGNVDYTRGQENYTRGQERCVILSEYPSSIMAYLKQRGLKAETLHALGVGWATLPSGGDPSRNIPPVDKSFLAFRFLEQGEQVNVQYKSPDKEFRFEKGCRIIPYNIDAIHDAQTVLPNRSG